MKKNSSTIIMILFFFIGLLVLFYPTISNYTNEKIQSKSIDKYEEIISNKKNDYSDNFKKADNYNEKLSKLYRPLSTYKKLGDYSNILSSGVDGMIGYISINKIKIELPIYAGTEKNTLSNSVGQLEGSSLPVGGLTTHSVLSAHRGLPSSKLFTDLDKIELGDTFVIKVLDRTLTYEVDKITIVKPSELQLLDIEKDKDYVTLMTCTPYGINTHRLLIRGHRVENARIKSYVSTEAFITNKFIVIPIICMPILLIWLLIIAFKPIKRKEQNWIDKYIYPSKFLERKSI